MFSWKVLDKWKCTFVMVRLRRSANERKKNSQNPLALTAEHWGGGMDGCTTGNSSLVGSISKASAQNYTVIWGRPSYGHLSEDNIITSGSAGSSLGQDFTGINHLLLHSVCFFQIMQESLDYEANKSLCVLAMEAATPCGARACQHTQAWYFHWKGSEVSPSVCMCGWKLLSSDFFTF